MKMRQEYLYKIIFRIRAYFPNSSVFSFINIALKSIGVFLYTHNIKALEDSNMSIYHMLLHLLLRKYRPFSLFKAFSLFLFALLSAYLLFIVISFLYWRRMQLNNKINSPIAKDQLLLKKKKPYYYTISICCCSMLMVLISLFNQHIIEALFASVSSLYGVLNEEAFLRYENPTMNSLIPLVSINILSIIFIAFIYVLFLLLSIQKSEIVSSGSKTKCSNSSFLFLFFSIFLQGMYSVTSLFRKELRLVVQMIMTIIILVYLSFDLLINLKHTSFYCSFISKSIYAIKLDCFVSSIIELLLYFTTASPISQKMSAFKQIFELLLAVCFFIITFHIWESKQSNLLSRNILLQTNRKITLEHLTIYFNLLKQYFSYDSMENFYLIFDIVHNHSIRCVNSHCPCHHISSFGFKEAEMCKNGKMEKLFKEIILIGEQEINNLIHSHIQDKNRKDIEELCLLHIDYIALIKHDFVYSFYLSHSYYNCAFKAHEQRWSFINRYCLYEIQRILLKSYVTKQKTVPNRLTSQKLNISTVNTSTLFTEVAAFNDYLLAVDTLHKCIFHCCNNLEHIVSFLSYANLKKSSSELMLKSFNQNIELNSLLYSNFIHSFARNRYRNMEVNYLLSNYLLMYHGEIPSEYKKDLFPCLYYSIMKKRSLLNTQYSLKENVIISSMESDDSFRVAYASQSFCDQFKWKKESIFNRDFNDLLPQSLGAFHNTYMKLFALFDNNTYEKESFILDETKSLHQVSLTAMKMLSLSNGFNILFVLNTKDETIAQNERHYQLLLDYGFNLLNMDQNFERHFYFSKQMLTRLKITVLELFEINKQRLVSYFKKLLKTHPKQPSLNEIIKSITVNNTIPNEKLFHYRSFDSFHLIYSKSAGLTKTITRRRRDFNANVNRIFQMIHYLNLENDVLERIISCRQLLAKTMLKAEENEEFNLTFTLKNINSLFYYVITVEDNSKNSHTGKVAFLNFSNELNESASYYGSDECVSPTISTIKHRIGGRQQPAKSRFSPTAQTKSPTVMSVAFLDSNNNLNDDKSINLTNLKLINASPHRLNRKTTRKGIQKVKKNGAVHKLFDNKFENRSLVIVIFFINVLLIVNSIYYYYSLTLSSRIFYINYFSFLLKDDVVFCSLFFIRNCLSADELSPIEASDLSPTFKIRNSLFLTNINRAVAYVNQLSSYDQLLSVYQVLHNESAYKSLRDDWNASTYNSTLIEELHKFHYWFYLMLSADDSNSCNVKEYSKPNWKNASRVPFIEEKVLYYINVNVLKTLINKLNQFSNNSMMIFQLIHQIAKLIYLVLSFVMLCFCFSLYVLLLLILWNGKLTIKNCLERLYIKETEDNNRLKKNLSLLKTVATEFTKQNCEKYEESLKSAYASSSPQSLYQSGNINKERLKNCSSNQGNQSNDDHHLSHSEESQLFRFSFENSKDFSNLTQIQLVLRVFIILTTLFLINFSLHITNLVVANETYNYFNTQNDISTNIIGRIPMYGQLVLYSMTSFIQNNPFYIPYQFKILINNNRPNLYNVSVDISTDSIYTVLKGSNYLFILYKLSIIQKTIEKFLIDDGTSNLFTESIHWNNQFNQKDYFPIASSVGFTQYFTQCTNLTQCFARVNQYSVENVYVSNKLALNGFHSLFELMLTELNSLFIDYRTNHSKDYNTILLLSNKDLWIIIENTVRVISMTSYVFNQVVGHDIFRAYSKSQQQGLTFSMSLILFSFISIYAILMIMVLKLRKTVWIIETVGGKIGKLKQLHSIK